MHDLEIKRFTYPRVSEILGKQTERQIKSVPIDKLVKASIRGTKIHNYCTSYLKNLLTPHIELEYQPYVEEFINWIEKNLVEVCFLGTRLFDDDLGFSGEFDLIGILKETEQLALIDIKTSHEKSCSWPVQLAAYYHLCHLNEIEVETAFNLHLKKTRPAQFEQTESGKIMVAPPKVKAVIENHLTDFSYYSKIFMSSLTCYKYFDCKEAA